MRRHPYCAPVARSRSKILVSNVIERKDLETQPTVGPWAESRVGCKLGANRESGSAEPFARGYGDGVTGDGTVVAKLTSKTLKSFNTQSAMICARSVFRCFKILERWGNYITGAAGPFFVGLAVILISLGVICFFDVIAPTLSFQIITIPICILIAVNLVMHYYYVVTVSPGFVNDPPRQPGTGILWAQKESKKGKQKALTGGVRWSTRGVKITPASYTRCLRCKDTRPERAHHCRICNKCVLKYDHHCPVRINQCVGLHNERHFVLFMAYLVLATFFLCLSGYEKFFDSIGISYKKWDHHVPEIMFAMIYILSLVLCFAVSVMVSYHLYGISWGETTVEAQDHEEYRKKAKARSEDFVNSYDLGKRKNLGFFFNVGESGYSILTLFFPLRIMPYTDGYSWARRDGHDRHQGLRQGEELTDEEDEDV